MIETKKIMTRKDADELAEIIIGYVEKHEMTESNIRDVMKIEEKHMRDNAILKKER